MDAEILEFWRRARSERPDIEVSEEMFRAFVAPVLDAEEGLEKRHAGDLLIACGCANGDTRALATFETEIMPSLDAPLARLRLDQSAREEVLQLLRERLFVAGDGTEAKIRAYSGRGPLTAWVRVVGAREALALLKRRGKQPVAFDESAWERVPDQADDAELEYIKNHYAAEFRKAFKKATHTLTPKERTLLRNQFIEQMTIEEIAQDFGVNRKTVSRWLKAARGNVLKETRKLLQQSLEVSRGELDSIMRVVESRLEISMPSVLVDTEE